MVELADIDELAVTDWREELFKVLGRRGIGKYRPQRSTLHVALLVCLVAAIFCALAAAARSSTLPRLLSTASSEAAPLLSLAWCADSAFVSPYNAWSRPL